MDDLSIMEWVFLFLSIVIMISVIAWMITMIIKSIKLQKIAKEREEFRKTIHDENAKAKSINYSERVLAYIRTFIAHVAVLKFQEFKDTKDLKKVSREHTKPLVSDVIYTVKESINMSNLNIPGLLFTEDYMEQYIIDVSIRTVKQLIEDAVKDYESADV